jgi:hypothetical protein
MTSPFRRLNEAVAFGLLAGEQRCFLTSGAIAFPRHMGEAGGMSATIGEHFLQRSGLC